MFDNLPLRCFVCFLSVFSDDISSSKDGAKTDSGVIYLKVVIILCVVVAVVAVSFFLFRFWQKKKRDERYARLIKLFEQDEELELELGLRD